MRVRYTVTTIHCPVCGAKIKEDNSLWFIALEIVFFIFSISLRSSYWIINTLILGGVEVPKVGKAFWICRCCRTRIRLPGLNTRDELNPIQRFNYGFRWWLRLSYLFGAIAIFMIMWIIMSAFGWLGNTSQPIGGYVLIILGCAIGIIPIIMAYKTLISKIQT